MTSSSSPSHSASASSSRSCKYDVFLSFRGEDTRKTFVDHLYSSLKQHLISVYKDDEALPRGESIRESLFEAIEESQIAVIIFSTHYADSSWCLEELAHIMKCKDERKLTVIPIFYNVEPTDVRNQKRKFGEAFAQQEAKNVNKAEIWKKALVDASNVAGLEPKNTADGHESQFITKIVDTILDRLFMLNSHVDEDLVGMRARLQELESLLAIESDGVRMIGIWGVGGSGKTTLATSAFMNISKHYQGHCIVENVREKTSKDGLNKLQEIILSSIFKKEVKVGSAVEGKHMMKKMLCRRKVLLLLDDVDTLGQLEALAGNRNWFGSGSRILITTRDEHLLRAHKEIHVFNVTLLSKDEAIQLFKRHAYNDEKPLEAYEKLSLYVVSYASGLPLALKVLGSFLYDKNKNEWISALGKLKDTPNLEVMDILKISYDGLETDEKELFLDIACFWRFRLQDDAMEILEACGYHPEIEIKVLIQKSLITIKDGMFDMHDLVQEMGHYIVRGKHPRDPEKHSRVWKPEEIKEMCFQNATMENDKIEAIKCVSYYAGCILSSSFSKIVSNMKKLRFLSVRMDHQKDDEYQEGPTFLSNELLYMDWNLYPSRSPFPDSFQPTKLVVLKLKQSNQKELWKGCKGNAIENGSMFILQPGLEIAKGFTPRLLRGSRYILKCPEMSWCDDFSGFLICVVSEANAYLYNFLPITVKKVRSCTYSVDTCEQSDGDSWKPPMCKVSEYFSMTWVWYVSFGSLKHTVWWDQIQTYKYLQFDIESPASRDCFGLGVRLIAKKSGSEVIETSTNSSTDYTPNITIEHDSAAALTISTNGFFDPMYPD